MPTLDWIGKDKVVNHHQEVPFRVLEHKYGFRADDETDTSMTDSGNKVIHGDNLEALKALLPEYEGRVDCIYIDPPYNTGEEGWVYNDNVNDPQLIKWLHQVVGKEGEDLTRHDKWACMMYPRLMMMYQLLSPNGVLFISNDDNENNTLRLICNEIFSRRCFVANVIWQKTYSPRNDSSGIPNATDYITVYSKRPNWNPNRLERTGKMNTLYKNPDNDNAYWTSGDAFAADAIKHQGMVYAIQHPFTGVMTYPPPDNHWRYGQTELLAIMNQWCEYELKDLNDAEARARVCGIHPSEVRQGVLGIVLRESLEESREKAHMVYDRGQWPLYFFTKGGFGGFRRKTYLNKVAGRLITNLWSFEEVGHTDSAKKELIAIFGGKSPFNTPKPSTLIDRILEIATDRESIVLDAFAGSGSTGHSVLKANNKDGGERKFILIELMNYAESITAERIRKVAKGFSFKGKETEVIYSQKLTIGNLKKASQFIEEAKNEANRRKQEFTKVSRPVIKENSIQVIGTKVYNGWRDGLGGCFDYYELGPRLFDDEGMLNETVDEEKIRRYVYYSETKKHLERQREGADDYLLDVLNHTAYYFYYNKGKATTLNRDTLGTIVRQPSEQYIVYADICLLDDVFLRSKHITFKQIPRNIKKF